jgi:hypothetical protein
MNTTKRKMTYFQKCEDYLREMAPSKKAIALTVLCFSTVLASCASKPDAIATAYVSPLQYQNSSCAQLHSELARVTRRAGELHGTLDKMASNDQAQMAVGAILFWPALFFLEGGDGAQAQEYARLKGERDALEQASTEKQCGIKVEEASSGKDSVHLKLKQLKELHDSDLISDAEYKVKRKELLSSL